jgi:hypothetical protein
MANQISDFRQTGGSAGGANWRPLFARRDSNQTGDSKLFQAVRNERLEPAEPREPRSCDSQWVGVNAQGARARQRCLVGQTLIFLSGRERIGGDGRNGVVLNGHDGPLKRNLQHFIHGLDKMYRKGREDFLRDVR